jgi:hypothetical protein
MEEQAGGKRSMWMSHVKKTMKANKGKSLMQVLKMAKKTYKKGSMKGGEAPVDEIPENETSAPATGGRRVSRKTRKTRKAKKSRKGGKKH